MKDSGSKSYRYIIELLNYIFNNYSTIGIEKLNKLLVGKEILRNEYFIFYFESLHKSKINNQWILTRKDFYITSDNMSTRVVPLETATNNFIEDLYDFILYKGANIDNVFKQING